MSQSRVEGPQNHALTGPEAMYRQSLTLGGTRAGQDVSSTMRTRSIFATVLSAILVTGVQATTLQQLSTDDMIRQSTAIVRAKVTAASSTLRGRNIYTTYQFQVLETLKAGGTQTQVAVPGGVANGLREMAPGAPTLSAGQEYVIFLWTSKSGLTQVIGLSQGLFNVLQDTTGNAVLVRPAAAGLVLDHSGNVVNDTAVTMKLSDLRTEVQKVLGSNQ
jgi:hypothetical protein